MGKKRDKAAPFVADLPSDTPATPAARGFSECRCPKKRCELRGDCLPCTAYHAMRGEPPRCRR